MKVQTTGGVIARFLPFALVTIDVDACASFCECRRAVDMVDARALVLRKRKLSVVPPGVDTTFGVKLPKHVL